MQTPLPENIRQTPEATQHRPWQVFSRAKVQYAIALEDGSELLEHAGVAAIPFPPPGLVGLVNWHGNPVPLADIALLSGAARRFEAARALILGHDEQAVALALDSLPNVLRLAPEFVRDAQQAPQEIRDLVDGVLDLPDRTLAYWLNAQRLADRLSQVS
jgi:chemotaxis signal transduction protein